MQIVFYMVRAKAFKLISYIIINQFFITKSYETINKKISKDITPNSSIANNYKLINLFIYLYHDK